MITGIFQNFVSVFGQVAVHEAPTVVDPVIQNSSFIFSDPHDAYLGVFAKNDNWLTGGGGKSLADPNPLIQRLGDVHPDVRLAAVWALGNIGDPRAIKPLERPLLAIKEESIAIEMALQRIREKVAAGTKKA